MADDGEQSWLGGTPIGYRLGTAGMSVLRLAGRDGRHRSTFKRNGTQLAEVRRKNDALFVIRARKLPTGSVDLCRMLSRVAGGESRSSVTPVCLPFCRGDPRPRSRALCRHQLPREP